MMLNHAKSDSSVVNPTGIRNQKLTFGSLFAGIGGMDLGLERAGMECGWQVEIDGFCRGVLERQWPNVKRHGDITGVHGSELGWVNGIAAGFPCQDVSHAGKQAGIDGSRTSLYREVIRIFRCLRPDWLLLENVSGLLDGGIGRVLGDLAKIGCDAEWDCYRTSDFGSPSVRERVFILAYPASYRLEGNGQQVLQRPNSWASEALDAWNGSSSPFREWRKLLAEPRIIRVAGGFAKRVDQPKLRLKAIGNYVSPVVVEWIGRRIMESCLSTLHSDSGTARRLSDSGRARLPLRQQPRVPDAPQRNFEARPAIAKRRDGVGSGITGGLKFRDTHALRSAKSVTGMEGRRTNERRDVSRNAIRRHR
jgi:DNA (cytosine-5)-methyltransferase 1